MVGRPDARQTSTQAPPRQGALWYRIEPEEDAIGVRLRLMNPPSQTTLFMPGPWAGKDDFDRHIILGHVLSPEGPRPMAVDRARGRIDIDAPDAAWIELTYRVRTHSHPVESLRFHPRSDDSSFFAYAPTLFVLPSAGLAEQLRGIPVEVHLPSQWTLATTWPLERLETYPDRQVAGFVVNDVRTLRDAFIGAGIDWVQLSNSSGEDPVQLTLAGDFALDEAALREAASTITEAYLRRFGIYDELFAILLPAGDDANNSLRGMGRHGGFVLEISPGQSVDEQFLILLAHEALHSWNGHQLVPAPEADEETTWFKEGVTHYLALKTLARLGLIDGRSLRRELAAAGQFYEGNPLISGEAVRSVDRARLPYDRGVLIALAIDAWLYEASDGALAVEDWIATLLTPAYLEQSRAYDMSLLRRAFLELSAELDLDLLSRYQRLVDRNRAIDVTALFRSLGLHYLPVGSGEPARLLPLDEPGLFQEIFFSSPEDGASQ